MKTTISNSFLNFLPRRILLLTLFISCFGSSAFSQNWFHIACTNNSSCFWVQVEAFDASNNSLGILNPNSGVTFPGGTNNVGCLPQSAALDHFDITVSTSTFPVCTASNTVSISGLTSTPTTFPLVCGLNSCGSASIPISTSGTSCLGFSTWLITVN